MAQTVIGKAKELIEEVGTEKAIAFFQKRIDDIGEPKNFQDVCNISGNEAAIDFIKMTKEEEKVYEKKLNYYLENGIDYHANTIIKADNGDLEQLSADSFHEGWNKAKEYFNGIK